MKKIIIANIGNRNIYYKNSPFDASKHTPNTFRAFTEQLIINFAIEKDHITPQILPLLIEKEKEGLFKIILFYSDLKGEDSNDKDTVYEAQLLQEIWKESYPSIQVELLPITCRVIDINQLMIHYRDYLKSIVINNPDSQFIICDAGGTAQQKSSLKIMAEFIISEDLLKTYNITLSGNGVSRIENIESIEYRKVICQEQILSLIRKGNYVGALDIFTLNTNYKNKVLAKCLEIAKLLYENQLNTAINKASSNQFGSSISNYSVFYTISNQSIKQLLIFGKI